MANDNHLFPVPCYNGTMPVSYTHLDVYKRQVLYYNRIILRSQKAGAEIVIRVYHGSDHIIKNPQYLGGKSDNDYGNGFYTTEFEDLSLIHI